MAIYIYYKMRGLQWDSDKESYVTTENLLYFWLYNWISEYQK